MEVVNVLDNVARTPIDPEVGIAIVPGVALAGVSIALAVVEKAIRPHYQKVSDEVYYVLKGEGEVTVGGETRPVRAGDVVSIPKGSVHSFVNKGAEPCAILFASGPKFEADKDRFFPDEK